MMLQQGESMLFCCRLSRRRPQARVLDQDRVDLARAVYAANQSLLDVGGAAGPGNKDDRAAGTGRIRTALDRQGVQQFFEKRHSLLGPIEGDVDGRSKGSELAAFGRAAQDQAA